MPPRLSTCLLLLFVLPFSLLAWPDPGPDKNYLGINLDACEDYSADRPFADIMKTARDWTRADNSLANVDAQGWPTEDAGCLLWDNQQMDGTYRLYFTGRAVQVGGAVVVSAGGTLGNWSYAAGTNVTSADMVFSSAASGTASLVFSHTTGGVQNVKLMRPKVEGGAASYPVSTIFTDQFIAATAPFQVIRTMGFTGTWASQQIYWNNPADLFHSRMPPGYASFNRNSGSGTDGSGQYSWAGKGVAWEYVILMANQLHKDIWINVPIRVNTDYVLKLAQLLRYGSDATGEPYTSDQASPVYPPLDPTLKVYVELGNELWNYGGDPFYTDAWYMHQQAIAEEATYHYDFDNSNNDTYNGWRRGARVAADISKTFRTVFGDARMLSQVRPVLEWQFTNPDSGSQMLHYLERYYDTTDPMSYLFYGGGGTGYYNPDDTTTYDINSIWSSGIMDVTAWMNAGETADIKLCFTYGMQRTAYEGGPSLESNGHNDAVKTQAWSDDRMRQAVENHHNTWSNFGGGLLTYLCLSGSTAYGFCMDVFHLDTPKLQAINELNAANRAALTYGNTIPAVIDGAAYHAGYDVWYTPGTGATNISTDQWASYLFNIPLDGTYAVSALARSGGASASLAVEADSLLLATDALGATTLQTPSHYVNFTKGLHSIRLKAVGNTANVTSLAVSASNIQDTTPPTAPTNLKAYQVGPDWVKLTWDAATDNYAVTSYQVYRNGVFIGTSAITTFTDAGLAAGVVTYTVRAVDIGGNQGPFCAPVTVSVGNPTPTPTPATDNSAIIVYPNPCRVGSVSPGVIYFNHLPVQSVIRIYNIAGEQVGRLQNLGSTAKWDVAHMAAGIYIYFIQNPKGVKKGKVGILR